MVIWRSTSSAAWPGHCVTIWTRGGARSGYASIGRFWNETTPQIARPIIATNTMNRCDRAKETMRSIMRPLSLKAVGELQEDAALRDDAVAFFHAVEDLDLVLLLPADLDLALRERSDARPARRRTGSSARRRAPTSSARPAPRAGSCPGSSRPGTGPSSAGCRCSLVTMRTGVVRVAGSIMSPMYDDRAVEDDRERRVAHLDRVARCARAAGPSRRCVPGPRASRRR